MKENVAEDKIINPHFDEDRVVWRDEYSDIYRPVEYSEQFDYEWKLFLEKKIGFYKHTGVETGDTWIDDRIHELTGSEGFIEKKKYGDLLYGMLKYFRRISGRAERRAIGGRLYIEPKFTTDHFKGKRCLDIGCGAGRWTKTLKTLGAKVKSVDVSEHALKSTKRFNDDVEYLDLFNLADKRHDLHKAFDFTICWGVVMCTHDPKLAFENVAMTVKDGGELYVMIYAPTYHNSPEIMKQRKYYHRHLKTIEDKLAYAYDISDAPENAINQLDMLNTFYNWTVPEETIYNWYKTCGFKNIITLNSHEKDKCAYHIYAMKK